MVVDTLPKLLLQNAKLRGDRPAIREKSRGIWRTTTWRALADESELLAGGLAARGLRRGDHVAFIGDNRPRLYAGMCAAQRLGAVVTPLFADATADEVADAIRRAGVTHVFAENQEQVDKLLDILSRAPSVRCVVYDEDRGMRHYAQSEIVDYAAFLDEGREHLASHREALAAELARGNGGDAAALFFTSGARGRPKGVILSQAALIDRARAAAAVDGLTDTDVTMAYLPPAWIGQHMFAYVQPITTGYCVCCPESHETIFADMREIGPTYFLGTPRIFEALFTQLNMRLEAAGGLSQRLFRHAIAIAKRAGPKRSAGEPLSIGDRLSYALGNAVMYGPLRDVLGMSRIRSAYTAGDVIDPDLLLFFRSIGVNLKQLYGSTEAGFFVAMQRDGAVRPETVGSAAEGVELGVTPKREILVRSAGLFEGYLDEHEATARARNAEGWLHTGDAGALGEDGELRFLDRLADLGTLADGAVFSPKLVESRLKLIPAVRQAVAFGDGRGTVAALIDIDPAAVARAADRLGISYTGHADLASLGETYDLIAEGLAEVNAGLAADPDLASCQIGRFAILRRPLSADDGDLTRTGKLRRPAIVERYRPLIEAMDAGRSQAAFEETNVRIGDAGAATAARERAAA